MTNPKLGKKRTCEECGARFYDLNKEEIICPKCNTTYQDASAKPSAPTNSTEDETTDINIDEFDEAVDIEDAEGDIDEYIEDVSDLGSDDDDMAEIIENTDAKAMDFD